jgi:DNA-binding FadR family transcriptional regulator
VADLFPVLDRPRSAVAGVEQHLKELIRAGRLVAGDRLPAERELAGRLGVNRSTLRGALQSLADQGVLAGRHGSGWTVEAQGDVVASNLAVYLRLEDVSFRHLFDARRAVEPAIAAGAAENRTEDQVAAMRACIAAMRAAAGSDSYVQADSDFHALIAAASGNPVFTLLITPALNLLGDVRRRIAGRPGVIAASHGEHEMILAAIERGDPDAARDAMLAHITGFASRSATALSQQDLSDL